MYNLSSKRWRDKGGQKNYLRKYKAKLFGFDEKYPAISSMILRKPNKKLSLTSHQKKSNQKTMGQHL